MIFKQAQQVLDGTKTQTRRPVKPGDISEPDNQGGMTKVWLRLAKGGWRLRWEVGRTYALQPGRGKKAVGRIRITKIRRERLWEITMEDAFAEGVHSSEGAWAVDRFGELWDRIYRKAAYRYQGLRWRDNPEVWMLEFERVEA